MPKKDVVNFIGADIPSGSEYNLEALLSAFAQLRKVRPDLRLLLASKRNKRGTFSVTNRIEALGIQDYASYFPYYGICNAFPVKKDDCCTWVDREVLDTTMSADKLCQLAEDKVNRKTALFFTSFHPGKMEGNSKLMRQWLGFLRSAGYIIHLVYYDIDGINIEDRLFCITDFDYYYHIPRCTELVGRNWNGLNVHVDDWCGEEALEEVAKIVSQNSFDIAITNYAFMSAIFEVIPSYTKKITLTHDCFEDRNRRMLAQGYSEAGWISLDRNGERLACQRADVVVAIQDAEAEYFKEIADPSKVVVISPVFETVEFDSEADERPAVGRKLRVGYVASNNWVNESNFGAFLRKFVCISDSVDQVELMVAGTFNVNTFCHVNQDGKELLAAATPRLLGQLEDLSHFYDDVDVIINPERGGTGIKIKTLEAMCHGKPVVSTKAGAIGLHSDSLYHNALSADDLAELVVAIAKDRSRISIARLDSRAVYERYCLLHEGKISKLLREPDFASNPSFSCKISLIIPLFNVEEFIGECLESVICQEYKNLEIIIVDDASEDRSKEIAESFAEKDPRLRIVTHEKNAGLGPARNTGVSHATGEYLLFLDSDDLFADAQSITHLLSLARRTNADVAIGSCLRLTADGSTVDFDPPSAVERLEPVIGKHAFEACMGLSDIYLPLRAWGSLVSTEFYKRICLEFPPYEHEDMPHTPFLYLQAGGGVAYSKRNVVLYRARSNSLSTSTWSLGKIDRYGLLWRLFKMHLQRFNVQEYTGASALSFVVHMLWRLDYNQASVSVRRAALSQALLILRDLDVMKITDKMQIQFTYISSVITEQIDYSADFMRFIRSLPLQSALLFYSLQAGIRLHGSQAGGGPDGTRIGL